MAKKSDRVWADATRLVTAGRPAGDGMRYVNPPIQRASTFLYPDFASLNAKPDPIRPKTYGRYGTTTNFAFEDAVADLNGADGAVALPSGKAAINQTLAALLKPGDHLLVTDNAYLPTRAFCESLLARIGVTTTFFDPLIGADIATLIRDETRLVFIETPGSHTFEVGDLPAIAKVAKAADCLVLADNTWATGLLFKAFDHGADIVMEAATKYLVGHSDAMLGVVSWRGSLGPELIRGIHEFGTPAGPDDCYLGLRGMRSLKPRLAHHETAALELATWLTGRPEVRRVLHPALPNCPGHATFVRDFSGSSGLFSIVLQPSSDAALAAMLDGLELFGMGASWGGFESLILPSRIRRSATAWPASADDGPLLRIHVGFEDTGELIQDLEAGLDRWAAAQRLA